MLKGKRKMTLYMPIDLHEDVKALANAAKPPMTQGDVTVQLMRAGLKTLCEKNVPAAGAETKETNTTEPADLTAGDQEVILNITKRLKDYKEKEGNIGFKVGKTQTAQAYQR